MLNNKNWLERLGSALIGALIMLAVAYFTLGTSTRVEAAVREQLIQSNTTTIIDLSKQARRLSSQMDTNTALLNVVVAQLNRLEDKIETLKP